MEINLNTSNYGYDLVITADNVKIVEDVETRTYLKNESGKSYVEKDVSEESLQQISQVLGDMVYCRKADFDSSDLIKQLFEKLPQETAEKLVESLHKDFAVEVE